MLTRLFRKKEKPHLEAQIQDLKDLGITFNLPDEELIEKLKEQFDPQAYGKAPYNLLISTAGTDLIDGDGNALWMSHDILSFDLECVEDEDRRVPYFSGYDRAVSSFVAELPLDVELVGQRAVGFAPGRLLQLQFDHAAVLQLLERAPDRRFIVADVGQGEVVALSVRTSRVVLVCTPVKPEQARVRRPSWRRPSGAGRARSVRPAISPCATI